VDIETEICGLVKLATGRLAPFVCGTSASAVCGPATFLANEPPGLTRPAAGLATCPKRLIQPKAGN
jgi:hypothetical protein